MEKFSPTFESLSQYQCPEWFRNVKFGIWSHWGPQSVPMYGDWYARRMYIENSPCYLYHLRHYGHPSEFGYKDICNLWKAENFNPDELMELYYKAGARYFVAQGMHHDNFFNFPSKYNKMNSREVGPMKDICGMWKTASEKYNMPFGLTEHLSASFSWWSTNKGHDKEGPYKGIPYDGNDPEYRDFYYDNYEHVEETTDDFSIPWYTKNKNFQDYWLNVMKEMIDLYKPDLIYTDGGLPFQNIRCIRNLNGNYKSDIPLDLESEEYKNGLEAVSYLYNTSIEKNGENKAVYAQKDRRPQVYNVGILDLEKRKLPNTAEAPWQTDTCIGNWFYDVKNPYKKPMEIIGLLVDIISKNGTMLLNILQKPDGSIDTHAKWILGELASWFEICSEGVYDTRPWKISMEGTGKSVNIEDGELSDNWEEGDYRFTKKDGNVYVFILKSPKENVAIIKSFKDEKIKTVELLGHGEVNFSHNIGILVVELPKEMPTEYANCLKITI